MRLRKLIMSLPTHQVFGVDELSIKSLKDNSKRVNENSLFVAIKGITVDAHNFIGEAINKGAIAVVGEQEPSKEILGKATYIKVSDSRQALGQLASAWNERPSTKMKVIGVTGTDGKTTTSNLIWWILNQAEKETGLVSTINAKIGKKTFDTGLHVTNPTSIELQKYLAIMVKNKCKYAVLEITSHGLAQGRVAGIKFDTAVLTNITHEHLDYHKTFNNYRMIKSRLFGNVKHAVLNKDDSSFKYIARKAHKAEIISYAHKTEADYRFMDVNFSSNGSKFSIKNRNTFKNLSSNLIGEYNIYNILAAISVARIYGCTYKQIKQALKTFPPLTGRLEEINTGKKFRVFVDFAHTPNALKNLLATMKLLLPKNKRFILIFGCAGNRDLLKRPIMGEIAAKYANKVIVTAEDPRKEDLSDIYSNIISNLTGAAILRRFIREDDRKQAIKIAINFAKKGDFVVITGKGHEKSMCFGEKEYHWSDQEEVSSYLRAQYYK